MFVRDFLPKTDVKIGYNTVLFSAFKSLVIFNFLSDAPHTMNEIKEVLGQIPFIKTEISNDSIRVYLNSLEKCGCKLEKKLTHNLRRQYTYHIVDTPFKPKLTKSLTEKLFDLYEICTYNISFDKFLEIDFFYKKLGKYLNNKYFSEKYESHSKSKDFDTGLLKTLSDCCLNNDVVTVMYNSPHSGLKEISIVAYEICIRNYKLYLQGFGKKYKEKAIFLIDRIQNIVHIEPYDGSDKEETLPDIVYELYDFYEPLDEDETIIETTADYRKIRRKVKNKLLTFQRILELGCECKVVAPEIYRNEIVSTLKSIKEEYKVDG